MLQFYSLLQSVQQSLEPIKESKSAGTIIHVGHGMPDTWELQQPLTCPKVRYVWSLIKPTIDSNSWAFCLGRPTSEYALPTSSKTGSSCRGKPLTQVWSYRASGPKNGLRAAINFSKKYQAFPGIVNGGLVSTMFDCHGNWTSAIALMDASQLPKPPFTLTSTLQVQASPQLLFGTLFVAHRVKMFQIDLQI